MALFALLKEALAVILMRRNYLLGILALISTASRANSSHIGCADS